MQWCDCLLVMLVERLNMRETTTIATIVKHQLVILVDSFVQVFPSVKLVAFLIILCHV